MQELKFYYDLGDENKRELNSFDEFLTELDNFRIVQETKDINKNLAINVWIENGNIDGVYMLSAAYSLSKSLFSKKIKNDEFIVAIHVDEGDQKVEYGYFTSNYDELKNIFYNFIVNHKVYKEIFQSYF